MIILFWMVVSALTVRGAISGSLLVSLAVTELEAEE
jgi:hypothetical protein